MEAVTLTGERLGLLLTFHERLVRFVSVSTLGQ